MRIGYRIINRRGEGRGRKRPGRSAGACAVLLALLLTFAAGCSPAGTQEIAFTMTMPEEENAGTQSEVTGIDEYTYSIHPAGGVERFLRTGSSMWGGLLDAEENMGRGILINFFRDYGVAQAGFLGDEIYLTGYGENGIFCRTVDPESGFYEDYMTELACPEEPCHVWTSPDGRCRIREETDSDGNRVLLLDRPGAEAQKLAVDVPALPGGAVWQCAWSADSSTAFLRVMSRSMSEGYWDSALQWALDEIEEEGGAGAAAELVPEEWTDEASQEFSRIWSVRIGEDAPAEVVPWEAGDMYPTLDMFPNLFAGETGEEILGYSDYLYLSSEEERAMVLFPLTGGADSEWCEAPGIEELSGRACLRGKTLIWAEDDVIQRRQIGEESGAEVLETSPTGEWIRQMIPEFDSEGNYAGCLAVCGSNLYRLNNGKEELLYRGKQDQLAIGLAVNRNTGDILIHYLDERTLLFEEPMLTLVRLRH